MRTRLNLACAACVLAITGCSEPTPSDTESIRPVRTQVIESGAATRTRTYVGVTESSQIVRLSFKVSGTIARLPVNVGDSVQMNAVIAQIDSGPYELVVQQATASLNQAQATARNAAASYERVRGLYEDGNASRNDLDSARAQSESASAQVRAAEKSLELASLDVDYTTLRATGDCRVSSVGVEVNENVSPSSAIAAINCGDAVEIAVDVPASLINQLRIGSTVEVTVPDAGVTDVPGTIQEIGVSASGSGSTYPVRINLGTDDPLRDGLSTEVAFTIEQDGSRITLPTAALKEREGEVYVYVVEAIDSETGTIAERTVELGEIVTGGVEVIRGLSPGDHVVTAGVGAVRVGLTVRHSQSVGRSL
ncbi:MAG: efflux RND transporter periplasmic adaptor subunit [Pseudomonadota bacterium]